MPTARSARAEVVVVGSGAAGLAAAVAAHDGGARVVVLEKADLVGGTTALSGGLLWVPGNAHMGEVGLADDPADAMAYLDRVTLGRAPDRALLEAYVAEAAGVVARLEAATPLRLQAPPRYSDYYADLPGGRRAGRSLEPVPFAAAALGEWAALVPASPFLPPVTAAETGAAVSPSDPALARLVRRRRREDVRARGSALVAALLRGVLDRGIPVLTGARARRLVVDGGVVVGVEYESGGRRRRLGARAAVVLASGGYEWNEAMVAAFLGRRVEPLSAPTNEGDGLAMAMEVGAALGNMGSYWGQPATVDPTLRAGGRPVLQFVPGRDRPGSIMVNRAGRRFVNEGVAYHDLVRAFGQFDPVSVGYPNEPPVWMVFDEAMRRRTPMLSIRPDRPAPAWVARAATPEALATRVGIDPRGLRRTVERFNRFARRGEDPDFHRGRVWFEAFMTDGPRPETSLGPLEEPPFYALEVTNGTIGTNGGPRTDRRGRVLRGDGTAVAGLYAAGNVAACVFGPGYPGGGATIGPALVHGYLAGCDAARWVAGRPAAPAG